MPSEADISFLLEHSYIRRRGYYGIVDTEKDMDKLFILRDFIAAGDSLPRRNSPMCMLERKKIISSVSIDFKNTYYDKPIFLFRKFRFNSNLYDPFLPSEPQICDLNVTPEIMRIIQKLVTLINNYALSVEVKLNERNSDEYKMRCIRIVTESYAEEMSVLFCLLNIAMCDLKDTLRDICAVFSPFQIFAFLSLILVMFSQNELYSTILGFDTETCSFTWNVSDVKLCSFTVNETVKMISDAWDTSTFIGNPELLKMSINPITKYSNIIDILLISPFMAINVHGPMNHINGPWYSRIAALKKILKPFNVIELPFDTVQNVDFGSEGFDRALNSYIQAAQQYISDFSVQQPFRKLFLLGVIEGASIIPKILSGLNLEIAGAIFINYPNDFHLITGDGNFENRYFVRTDTPTIFVSCNKGFYSSADDVNVIRRQINENSNHICLNNCNDLMVLHNDAKKSLLLSQDICDYLIGKAIKNSIANCYEEKLNKPNIEHRVTKHHTKRKSQANESAKKSDVTPVETTTETEN